MQVTKAYIAKIITSLEKTLKKENYSGYDPYDGLSSNLIKILCANNKFLRIIIQQAFKILPINLRRIFGIKKDINPKGMGLIALGYIFLYKSTKNGYFKARFEKILNWLIDNNSKNKFKGYAWGYNFDWQSRAFFLPKGIPTTVNTSFIGRAFIHAYEATGNKDYLSIARSACDFLLTDVKRYEDELYLYLSYSPIDNYIVYNANALAAGLFSLVYNQTGEEWLIGKSNKIFNYISKNQNKDGSWNYGKGKIAKKTGIDNFHSGFILESFDHYFTATNSKRYEDILKKGVDFYETKFFLATGAPKYFPDKIFPLDIHSAAQAIITLTHLERYLSDKNLPEKVLEWMIKNMWDPIRANFYYRKYKVFINKIPYLRWSEAWAFYALSAYLNKKLTRR